ncbi:ribosome maturation factor RimP [Deferrisoma sp.]
MGLLGPVVEDAGYELVDLRLRTEAGRLVLRVLADRPGGITLDECARLSRELSAHMDVADPIRGAYVLEVSSPGIRRPLTRPEHFDRFAGERVVVKTTTALEGRKTFRGTNAGLSADGRSVRVEEHGGGTVEIPLEIVREAQLDPEIRF